MSIASRPRKTKPSTNGHKPTFDPPEFVEKNCEVCGAKYQGWETKGQPLPCPECESKKPPLMEKACTGCGREFFTDEPRDTCLQCAAPSGVACQSCGTDIVEAIANGRGKKKEKAKPPSAPTTETAAAARAPRESIEISVELGKIEIRAQQREAFDAEKLAGLAEEIARDGMLQPPVVRHNPGNARQPYLLVAGERRIRAAKSLGWTSLNVHLLSGEVSDAEALTLQGAENAVRENFNDVELARWCQLVTSPVDAGGGGLTQKQLAKRLGVTQAEISNRIRLLRAPAWALQLVISGQMSRKHAMELLAFENFPELLKPLEKATLGTLKQEEELGTAADYAEVLGSIAWRETGALAGSDYRYELGGSIAFAVEPTEAEREQLRIVVLEHYGAEAERALNKKLAAKLLAKAKAAAIKKAEQRATKKTKGEKAKVVELTPAEQKRREADQARQHKARLEAWFHDWLRVLCAERLLSVPHGPTWLTLWALAKHAGNQGSLAGQLAAVAKEIEPDVKIPKSDWNGPDVAGLLEQLADRPQQLAAVGDEFARRLLVDVDGSPVQVVYPEVVVRLARVLSIDVAGFLGQVKPLAMPKELAPFIGKASGKKKRGA